MTDADRKQSEIHSISSRMIIATEWQHPQCFSGQSAEGRYLENHEIEFVALIELQILLMLRIINNKLAYSSFYDVRYKIPFIRGANKVLTV